MITTNFFANSDSFENQKAFSPDSSKANTFTEDFAAFFNVPVLTAQTSVPMSAARISLPAQSIKPENVFETKTIVPIDQILPGGDYQTEPIFSQNGKELKKPDLIQTNDDNLPVKEEISPADGANFAAFFNVPVLTIQAAVPVSAAQTFAPEQAIKPENFVETKNVVSTDQNPPGENNQAEPIFRQNNQAGQQPNLIQTNDDKLPVTETISPAERAKFADLFKMPVSSAKVVKPVSAAKSFTPAQTVKPENVFETKTIVPIDRNVPGDDYQSDTFFLPNGEESPKPNLIRTNENVFPVNNEFSPADGVNIADTKSTLSTDSGTENQPVSNFFGEISNRNPAEKNNYTFQINNNYQNSSPAGFTINLSLESMPALSSQIQTVKPELKNSSTEVKQEDLITGAPEQFFTAAPEQLFIKDSNVEKTDFLVKTNLAPDDANEQKIFEQTKQDVTKESGQISVKTGFKFGTENQLTPRFTGKVSVKNILQINTYQPRTFIHHEGAINKVLTTISRGDYAPPLDELNFPAPKQAVNDQVTQTSPQLNRVKVSEKPAEIFSEISANRKTGDFYRAASEIETTAKQMFSEQAEINVSDNKISGFQNRTQPNNGEAIQISPELNQQLISGDVPKLFNKFLNAAKADNSANTNFTLDSDGNRKIVEQIKQNNFGETGQNLNEPQTPGSEKQSQVQDTAAVRIFDNLPGFNVKNPQNIESAPLINDLQEKVFGQIEPQILELANRTSFDNGKKIFKMRLNPAELGAVEITVEKSSTGVISAHFQTESEKTRHILNESLVQLRTSLENSGCPVGNLEISCGAFSSNENERRQNQSPQFGATENQSVETTNLDGNSNIEDDDRERLVSLRA